jgi:hypothetical protein
MKAFGLPRGRSNWHQVKERINWCQEMFGTRVYGSDWNYDAVHHMIVIKDDKMVLLYSLRWS